MNQQHVVLRLEQPTNLSSAQYKDELQRGALGFAYLPKSQSWVFVHNLCVDFHKFFEKTLFVCLHCDWRRCSFDYYNYLLFWKINQVSIHELVHLTSESRNEEQVHYAVDRLWGAGFCPQFVVNEEGLAPSVTYGYCLQCDRKVFGEERNGKWFCPDCLGDLSCSNNSGEDRKERIESPKKTLRELAEKTLDDTEV